MADYQPPEGFITMAQAQERLRVAKATVQRMARDGRLTPFSDPRNKKVTLFRIEDIEALAHPVPKVDVEGEAAA